MAKTTSETSELVKVKINGVEREVTKDEAIAALQQAIVARAPKTASESPKLKERLKVRTDELMVGALKGSSRDIVERYAAIMLCVHEGTTSQPVKGGAGDCPSTKPTIVHYRHTDAYGVTYADWTVYKNALQAAGLFAVTSNTFAPTDLAQRLWVGKPNKGETFPTLGSPKVSKASAAQEIAALRAQIEALKVKK